MNQNTFFSKYLSKLVDYESIKDSGALIMANKCYIPFDNGMMAIVYMENSFLRVEIHSKTCGLFDSHRFHYADHFLNRYDDNDNNRQSPLPANWVTINSTPTWESFEPSDTDLATMSLVIEDYLNIFKQL